MRGYNKVILMGNLAKDPELRYTPSGKSTASCDIAINKAWKDDNGDVHESVDFIRCIAWGGTAEAWCKYLKKGSGILVEGRLATRSYTDKNDIKRYVTEVIVERSNFVGGSKTANVNSGKVTAQTDNQPQSYRGRDTCQASDSTPVPDYPMPLPDSTMTLEQDMDIPF